MIICADFETVNDIKDCRVWGYSYYNIDADVTLWGTSINDFMVNHLLELPTNSVIYFHNLKFDGEFIFYWLFENDFTHTKDRVLVNREFKTLISNMGQFYSIEICYHGRKYKILDSAKIIPMSVSKMSKAFGIPQVKGTIDYMKYRPVGYTPNATEIQYMINDVEIVGKSLKYFFSKGLNKMTQASNALSDFKSVFGTKNFNYNFPILDSDAFLRASYKGGFTYVNPKYQGKRIERGIVLDVNSLYPSVMYNEFLPYGEAKKFIGKPITDNNYFIYIVNIICQFEIKEKHIPTLQIKGHFRFGDRDYLESSEGEEVSLTMTNVDLELFMEHYDVYNLQYIEGYLFLSTNKIFREYIDKWTEIKIRATIDKNEGLRTIAKLMLNALYGKYGSNPLKKSKYPYYKDGCVEYETEKEGVLGDPVYVALASFVTAYARAICITSAQQNFDRFIYADTDSLHLVGEEMPLLDIHKADLGKWKYEGTFTQGLFVRAKSYIEEYLIEDFDSMEEEKKLRCYSDRVTREVKQLKVTCSGMPETCHQYIHLNNFKDGTTVSGKLQARRVKGGVCLVDSTFTLKL